MVQKLIFRGGVNRLTFTVRTIITVQRIGRTVSTLVSGNTSGLNSMTVGTFLSMSFRTMKAMTAMTTKLTVLFGTLSTRLISEVEKFDRASV